MSGYIDHQHMEQKFEEYKKWVKDEIVIIVQIEHIDAVTNIDEILKVDGGWDPNRSV